MFNPWVPFSFALLVLLCYMTRRHRADIAECRERTAQASAWLDGSPEATLILDDQGLVCRANPAAERLFGWPPGEALGCELPALVSADPNHRAVREVLTLLLGPANARTHVGDCVGRKADGATFPLRIRGRRIEHAERPWLAVSLHDLGSEERIKNALYRHVTQLVATKEALQLHNDRLENLVRERTAEICIAKEAAEKANCAKSTFLANMSHELRTPLHGILSFARFGVQKVGTADREKLAKYFDRISASGNTLLVLLNEVLDLSKLEAGAVTLHCTALDVHEVIGEVCDELAAFARERQLSLNLPPRDEPAWVWGDGDRLAQVVRNLLNNAIKFSPDGASIDLAVATISNAIVVTVQDHGPGIPDDECEAVFDKFVQAKATATGSGGTGLGLTICREIVSLHQGTVRAEPTHGHGARIRLVLPRYTPATPPLEQALETANA